MNSKLFWILLICLWSNKFLVAQAPLWQWAKEANSPGSERARDVAFDGTSGNIYIGGSFNGGLGAVYGISLLATLGQEDGFVAKYDPQGSVLWAFKIGGLLDEEVKCLATDPAGNLYVAGVFNSICDFDPSAASYNLIPAGLTTQDGFLAKYDSQGTLLWATRFGNAQNENVWGLYADANGVYLTGSYYGTATFVSASPSNVTMNTTAVLNQNYTEFFGAKYSSAGVVQWVVSGASQRNDAGYDVVADNNLVYFIGIHERNLDLFNASGSFTVQLQVGNNNNASAFVAAYDQSSGALNWATNAGCLSAINNDDVYGNTIALDNTYLYISGAFEGTASFPVASPQFTKSSSGNDDMFLAQLSKQNGAFQWVSSQTCTGNGDEWGDEVEVDAQGNVIVAGRFSAGITFSAGPVSFSSSGNEDIMVSAYSSSGNFLWASKAGAQNDDIPYGLATGTSGAVYVAGDHANATVFGTHTLTNGSSSNVFVAKTGCETVSNNTITSSQTLCAVSTPSLLLGSLPSGGTFMYTWEQSSNSVTWTPATAGNTAQNYAPPQLNTTMYYRRKVTAGNACPNASFSNTVSLIISPMPAPAVAGGNQTLCISAAAASLNANTPGTGIGSWSLLSGSLAITSPTLPSSTVTGFTAGSHVLAWTIVSGACPASSATMQLWVDDVPGVSFAGNDVTLCNANATLTAALPLAGSGNWLVAQGNGLIASAGSATSVVNNLSSGTNAFVWTISNGSCPSSSDTVFIFRDVLPTPAFAGRDTLMCAAAATLQANLSYTGSGSWSVISGSSSVNNPLASGAMALGLSSGPNVFVWQISNGTCPSSFDTLVINADLPPGQAQAGRDQRLCIGSATLQAAQPLAGTAVWSIVSGAALVADSMMNTSSVTLPDTGSYVLRWTVKNGICPMTSDEVVLLRDAMPDTAYAGPDQRLEIPEARLDAALPNLGKGNWELVQGDGVIDDEQAPTAKVIALATGNNIFRWTLRNGTCPSNSDEVLIYLEPLKIPNGFSPNGDGINDTYVIPGIDYYDRADFSVFNRWGALVYHNMTYKNEWTGSNQNNELLADDTYYYTLNVSDKMSFSGYIIIKTSK